MWEGVRRQPFKNPLKVLPKSFGVYSASAAVLVCNTHFSPFILHLEGTLHEKSI